MLVKGFVLFELEGMTVAACLCWLDWYVIAFKLLPPFKNEIF